MKPFFSFSTAVAVVVVAVVFPPVTFNEFKGVRVRVCVGVRVRERKRNTHDKNLIYERRCCKFFPFFF